MSRGSRSRARAVRSTPEALQELEAALQEKWRREFPRRRLTRALRAELLDISEGTVSRLFQNSGVDRPTLIHAFKNVGLVWTDEYLLVNDSEADDAPAEVIADPPVAPLGVPLPTRSVTSHRKTQVFAILAVVFAVIALGLYINRPRPGSSADWTGDFAPLLQRGTTGYQAGDYDQAQKDLEKAVEMARAADAPGYLSCALHVLGDLQNARGQLQDAENTLDEARSLREVFQHDRFLPAILCSLGETRHRLGKLSAARISFEKALAGYRHFSERPGIAMALRGLGTVDRKERKFDDSLDHFAEALRTLDGLTDQAPMVDDIVARRAMVYRDLGDFKRAREDVMNCLAHWRERGHQRWVAETEFQLATIEGLAGNSRAALKLLSSCNEAFRQVGDRANEADSAKWLERYRLSRR